MLKLELYEAQISAVIRETLQSGHLNIRLKGMKLLEIFLLTPGTRDSSVVKKTLTPLIDSLSEDPQVKLLDGYTLEASAIAYFTTMLVLSNAYLLSPDFIVKILHENKELILFNLRAIVYDLSIIFTQSKASLKGCDLRLSVQVVKQDHPKLGYIDVFLKTLVTLNSEEIHLVASMCITFMFLTTSASSDSFKIASDQHLTDFVNRRTTLLETLKIVIKQIIEPAVLTEILSCLELCIGTPLFLHQKLILEIISEVPLNDSSVLIYAENILHSFPIAQALTKYSLKAHRNCVLAYIVLYFGDIPDEKLVPELAESSILSYFSSSICYFPALAISTLSAIWDICEISDFKESLSSHVLLQLIENHEWRNVLNFLATFTEQTLQWSKEPIDALICALSPEHPQATALMTELINVPNSAIFYILSPHVLSVFRSRTPAQDCIPSALKFLLVLYKSHPDKNTAITAVIPILLGLYSTASPPELIRTVSKTLHGLASTAPAAFKSFIQSIPECEKKYLENQILQATATTNTTTEPSITLQLKLRNLK